MTADAGRCRRCGAVVISGERFCGECGLPLAASAPPPTPSHGTAPPPPESAQPSPVTAPPAPEAVAAPAAAPRPAVRARFLVALVAVLASAGSYYAWSRWLAPALLPRPPLEAADTAAAAREAIRAAADDAAATEEAPGVPGWDDLGESEPAQPVDATPFDSLIALRRAARLGDADAQYTLARFYYDGFGSFLGPDTALADQWLRAAAAQGHPLAQTFLVEQGRIR